MLTENQPLLEKEASNRVNKFSARTIAAALISLAVIAVIAFNGPLNWGTNDAVATTTESLDVSGDAATCPSSLSAMTMIGPLELSYFDGTTEPNLNTQMFSVIGTHLTVSHEYFPFIIRANNAFSYDPATCKIAGVIGNDYPFLFENVGNTPMSATVDCPSVGKCFMVFTADVMFTPAVVQSKRRLLDSSSSSKSSSGAAQPPPPTPKPTMPMTTTKQPTNSPTTTTTKKPTNSPTTTTKQPTQSPTQPSSYPCNDLVGAYHWIFPFHSFDEHVSVVPSTWAHSAKVTNFNAKQQTGCLFEGNIGNSPAGEGVIPRLFYCPNGHKCDILVVGPSGMYEKSDVAYAMRKCLPPYSVVSLRVGFVWAEQGASMPYVPPCVNGGI